MSFIAEVEHDSALMGATFRAEPALELEVEEVHYVEDDDGGSLTFFYWIGGVDRERFERAHRTDPHVAAFALVAAVGTRWLYRSELTDEGLAHSVYPLVAANDVVVQDVDRRIDGTTMCARFPSRAALKRFLCGLDESDRAYSVRRIVPDDAEDLIEELTPKQREAVALAFERGYYDTPRRASLADLAPDLDISPQALATRLRRAHGRLVERSLSSARRGA